MDPKTKRVLARITARMPRRLREHLMRTETDDSELAMVEHALASHHISDDKKRQLRRLKAKGAFNPIVEEVSDESIEREIDAYYTRAINAAIAKGELKPASASDSWYQKRQAKAEEAIKRLTNKP